jgi:hypothetical protein
MKEEILQYFINEVGVTNKIALMMYDDLKRHQDILEEFYFFLKNRKFKTEAEGCISVEGYTAEGLTKETYLKPIGAFNYLISLREHPKRALENLAQGLPRK